MIVFIVLISKKNLSQKIMTIIFIKLKKCNHCGRNYVANVVILMIAAKNSS